jgi:hypothetical protein
VIDCAHCGTPFKPTRRGHIYCTPDCRHAGPARFGQQEAAAAREAVARLFDEGRDPQGLVEPGDWYPHIGTRDGDAFGRLENPADTVGGRRGWYLRLRRRS